MALDNIEQLLEKYDNAETSLAEEAQIRAYFAKEEDVAPHLESYRLLFQYVSVTKEEQFTKELPLQPKRNKTYQWIAVAAVIAISIGAYFQMEQMHQKTTLEDLSHEELLAYNQTIAVFSLVSSKMNQGTSNLEAFKLVSLKLNEGAGNLGYLKDFQNTAKRIIRYN
ncbi:hypothetical protein ES711_01980 [Gelidibacter salicanalis]|uniref:DUF3379 domain-containing protein n=1 Tax=Gelidibacter salicanalis TaxID=291193 RepID=A0A5C7AST5_9FLAO|nr:hypothetical protein [Gelidibacter salicanalis]TXE10699.1 hypothetical protein ES711_01980 [Gelidibacter salicanalis]